MRQIREGIIFMEAGTGELLYIIVGEGFLKMEAKGTSEKNSRNEGVQNKIRKELLTSNEDGV